MSEGPSMITVYEKLDTLSNTIVNLDKKLTIIDVHLQGFITPPTLETRLKNYVDERDLHKQKGLEQIIVDKNEILRLEQENAALKLNAKIDKVEEDRKTNHKENTEASKEIKKRISRLERICYIGYGLLLAAMYYFEHIRGH